MENQWYACAHCPEGGSVRVVRVTMMILIMVVRSCGESGVSMTRSVEECTVYGYLDAIEATSEKKPEIERWAVAGPRAPALSAGAAEKHCSDRSRLD